MNVLSIDVEDYFHVNALSEVIKPSDWDDIECRYSENTRKLLDIFSEFDVKATFFVLGWAARKDKSLVRAIVDAGHEVASHGMSHQLIYTQHYDIFKEETLESKKLLEDISGTRIKGYRAASYSITKQSEWALDVLVDAGFEYDSSLFPIKHDVYGYATDSKQPYHLTTPGGGSLIEFPLSVYEIGKFAVPMAGGGYFRLFPYWFFRHMIKSQIKKRRHTVFYLHPWEVDPGQPRIDGISWKSRFRHYNNLDKCELRLRRLLSDFNYVGMYECLKKLKMA